MDPFRRVSKNRRSNIVRIGNREIITRGLNSGFWTDLYHRSMSVSWPVFFASAALVFLALNGIFALVFFLGHEPIANVPTGSFIDLFFFSIETLAATCIRKPISAMPSLRSGLDGTYPRDPHAPGNRERYSLYAEFPP
jgi:hypothetical protein